MNIFKAICFVIVITVSMQTQAKDNLQINIQELDTRGFTIVPNVFTPKQIQQMAENFHSIKSNALDIIQNTPAKPRRFNENNTDNKSMYWKTDKNLILQAGKGRYDLYKGFDQGIFGTDVVLHNKKLEQLMTLIMGGEYTSYSGIIHSTSGNEDQYWHRDTNNLTNHGTDGAKLVMLDDFYFTILIPITVPFTIENGTTEFLAGSHRQSAENFAKCPSQQIEVPLGSALVFNGKINHRGKANLSDQDRPALYLVYHKNWYNDQYRQGVE